MPCIGKKTAERLALELRGKLSIAGAVPMATDGLFAAEPDASDDILSTLLALGYNEREAKAACKGLPAGCDVSEGVRLALKNMLK